MLKKKLYKKMSCFSIRFTFCHYNPVLRFLFICLTNLFLESHMLLLDCLESARLKLSNLLLNCGLIWHWKICFRITQQVYFMSLPQWFFLILFLFFHFGQTLPYDFDIVYGFFIWDSSRAIARKSGVLMCIDALRRFFLILAQSLFTLLYSFMPINRTLSLL